MRFHAGRLLFLVTLACCGGNPPPPVAVPPTAVVVAPHVDAPATKSAPAGALPMKLPAGAALRASVDLSQAGTLGISKEAAEILGALNLPFDPRPAEVGLDVSRPIQLALFAYDDEQRRRIDPLRAIAEKKEPSGWRKVQTAFEAERWLLGRRVLMPIVDQERFTKKLEALLLKHGYHSAGEGLYESEHAALRVQTDGRTASIDTIDGLSKIKLAMLAELDERIRKGEDGPAIDGALVRIVYQPPALAYVGFVMGVIPTLGAVGGGSVEPAQADRIGSEGLLEAADSFGFVDFDDVDVRLGVKGGAPDVTVRGTPRAGFSGPPEQAWASSPSVEVAGMWPRLDVGRAFDGWMRPFAFSPFDWQAIAKAKGERGFWSVVKDAGILGGWIGHLPQALLFGARAFERDPLLPTTPEATAAFERSGLLTNGKDTVFFGLLPEKATQADAKKALAGLAAKPPAKTTEASSTLEVDHRWVVLRAKEGALLPKRVTLKSRGPFVMAIGKTELATKFNFAALATGAAPADHLVGDVSRDGKTFLLTFHAP